MPGARLGLEQVAQMLGGIPVGPTLRDREAVDLADMLLETATDIERTACLDTAYHREHIGAGNGAKIDLAEGRKRIPLQPGQEPRGMTFVERGQPVGMPRACGFLEGHDCGWLIPSPRVQPLPQCDLGFRAAQPSVSKPHAGVLPERQQLLLAVETVFEAPELGAVGPHEKVEPLSVGELVVLVAFGGVACFEVLESHGGISCRCRHHTPENTPKCKSTSWHSATLAGTLATALRLRNSRKKGTKKPPQDVLGGCGIVGFGCGDRI